MREDRSAWPPLVLILGAIALLGALLVGFVPMADCPDCRWIQLESGVKSPLFSEFCVRCRSSGKITLADRWLGLR